MPQTPNDSTDLSADLLPGGLSEFASAGDIRQFLARLLAQVTKGRISPRRATVLAFITNQLLHSHRAIHKEADAQKNAESEPPRIIIDMPRPDRDDLVDPERGMYARMAARNGSAHATTDSGDLRRSPEIAVTDRGMD